MVSKAHQTTSKFSIRKCKIARTEFTRPFKIAPNSPNQILSFQSETCFSRLTATHLHCEVQIGVLHLNFDVINLLPLFAIG